MRFLFIFFLCISNLSFSQTITYDFDYRFDYEAIFFKHDTLKQTRIFLTNSRDNSYYAVLTEIDSLNYRLIFHDRNGRHADLKIKKSVFNNTTDINVDCKNVAPFTNRYKKLVKDYRYVHLGDTILNKTTCEVYRLESVYNQRKTKRKKMGSNIYIINKSIEQVPKFEHELAYEEWKKEKPFSKGMCSEIIFMDYKDRVGTIQKLQSFKKNERLINLIGNCNHQNTKIDVRYKFRTLQN